MKLKLLITLCSILSTSICHSGLFSEKKKYSLTPDQQASDVFVSYGDNGKESAQLRLVTRGATAKTVGLKTMQFLFVGNTRGFSKEELKGNEITDISDKENIKNPIEIISKQVHDHIQKLSMKKPEVNEKQYYGNILFTPITPYWSLVYDSSDSKIKDGYKLTFGLKMSRRISDENLNKSHEKFELDYANVQCNYHSSPLSLNVWKENDYLQVAKHKTQIINECTDKLIKSIDKFIEKPINISTNSI